MLEHRRIDEIHVVEGGPRTAPAVLFLHGWPQCWAAFERVMETLADTTRVVAIDLPGIGESRRPSEHGDKRSLARIVAGLVDRLELHDVTLVGHDVGGMIVYAFLRDHPDAIARAAILDVVIPGIEPWSKVLGNPHVWHFGFHAVPELPEQLVHGREAMYFDFFFNAIAASPDAIGPSARARHARAYATISALRAGFDWYRAFARDAEDNRASCGQPVDLPVLYVRGAKETGDPETYVRELRAAGLRRLRGEVIANSGHFTPDEQPAALAGLLRRFIREH
jgi:pimeloyl-ACP methyl ester carboxylesterase